MGVSLDFIVDSVERLVLPVDSKAGFELLVAMFEADHVAMENCGEHDWEVVCAYKRAAGVMAEAAKHLPRAEIEERVKGLIEGDAYGVRAGLLSGYCMRRKPDEHSGLAGAVGHGSRCSRRVLRQQHQSGCADT
jgi:hypothetical protein